MYHPRQEAKLLIYLYKMLTSCLIVLIFGLQDFHHCWAKLRMCLQVCQLLRVLFLCYLVVLPVFSCILSQHYYLLNSLCLIPAEILRNNTQAHLNYVIKICSTVAGYPVTLIMEPLLDWNPTTYYTNIILPAHPAVSYALGSIHTIIWVSDEGCRFQCG